MGYFDKITEGHFKQKDDGTFLYFPHGNFGKARHLPDRDARESIYRTHKRQLKWVLISAIIFGQLIGLAWAGSDSFPTPLFVLLVLIIAPFSLLHWRNYRRYPKADDRISFRQFTNKTQRAIPDWYPTLLAALGFGTLFLTALMPITVDQPMSEMKDLILMGTGLGVFGILLAWITKRIKRRAKRDEELSGKGY